MWASSGLENPPTKWLSTLKRWSTEGDWQKRVAAYDRAIQEAEDTARAEIRAERRKQLEDQDFRDGNALRDATRAILLELPRFIRGNVQTVERNGVQMEIHTLALKAGPGELARALETASKIQRLSVGEATEIHKLVESELGAMLDLLQSQLTPEEYARVVAVIAGGAAT